MSTPNLGNPWLSIWVKPRQTIRQIIMNKPSFRIFPLSLIYGFPLMLFFAQSASWAQSFSLPFILAVALLAGFVVGYISINISSMLLFWTGKWIGGIAQYKEVRAAVAWANAPNYMNGLLWIVSIGLFGSSLFFADFAVMPFTGMMLYYLQFAFIVQVVVSVWSFILFLNCLAEVQGYSTWKAFLNMLLPVFVVFLIVWLIGFLFSFLGTGVN